MQHQEKFSLFPLEKAVWLKITLIEVVANKHINLNKKIIIFNWHQAGFPVTEYTNNADDSTYIMNLTGARFIFFVIHPSNSNLIQLEQNDAQRHHYPFIHPSSGGNRVR